MKYNKLVRDKIPDIIKKNGEIPITKVADDELYWTKLREKLLEEVNEFLDNPTEEEFVDILEVTDAISNFKEYNLKEIKSIKEDKNNKHGKFENRIILEDVKDV